MFDVGFRSTTQPTVYIYKEIKHRCGIEEIKKEMKGKDV